MTLPVEGVTSRAHNLVDPGCHTGEVCPMSVTCIDSVETYGAVSVGDNQLSRCSTPITHGRRNRSAGPAGPAAA